MNQDNLIIKGFNDGYLLQKHKPKLASQIQQGFVDKNHDYAQGFTKGRQEFNKEASKDKSNYMDSLRSRLKKEFKSKNADKGKNTDLSL